MFHVEQRPFHARRMRYSETMSVLSQDRIAILLAPYLSHCEPLIPQLEVYLELLVRWNAKTNLTSVRDPEEMVRRHFGESLFAAQHLGDPLPPTLLDLGSGAGFPGIPIALAHPGVAVTLAESQGKKASFLREAVRTLSLPNVEVCTIHDKSRLLIKP